MGPERTTTASRLLFSSEPEAWAVYRHANFCTRRVYCVKAETCVLRADKYRAPAGKNVERARMEAKC